MIHTRERNFPHAERQVSLACQFEPYALASGDCDTKFLPGQPETRRDRLETSAYGSTWRLQRTLSGLAGRRLKAMSQMTSRLRSKTRRSKTLCAICLAMVFTLMAFDSPVQAGESSFAQVVQATQPKLVKIYGAGGIKGLEGYQSGFFISAEGHLLTSWSLALDTDEITVILNDGHKLTAQLVGADPRREIALLKVEGEHFAHFDLKESVQLEAGARVLAFSNLFKIATGNEPVSVLHGSISVRTNLSARKGTYATPYRGPVYILDAITNNPGAAGGALTDREGRFVGMLGKELRNSLTNAWLNYALPAEEVQDSVDDLLAGKVIARENNDRDKPENPLTLASLGFSLVPEVIARTPPYLDAVQPNSPAASAGLRRDDLIVMLDNQLMPSCAALKEALSYRENDAEITLTVVRGSELIEIPIEGLNP